MNGTGAEPVIESPLKVLKEECQTHIRFNVMPERPVEESLHVHEYRLGPGVVEAHFDRTYRSSMLKSPSHLIFLTAVVHLQKMVYVYACDHLDLVYDPFGPERLKIWPTNLEIEMGRMIRDEEDLVHRVYIERFEQVAFKRYEISVNSDVNGILKIRGQTPLFVL